MPHTYEPWVTQENAGNYDIYAEGMVIAKVAGYDLPGGTAEAEANAHLIAAAPAMLAKLEEVAQQMDVCADLLGDYEDPRAEEAANVGMEIRQLIAQARGK